MSNILMNIQFTYKLNTLNKMNTLTKMDYCDCSLIPRAFNGHDIYSFMLPVIMINIGLVYIMYYQKNITYNSKKTNSPKKITEQVEQVDLVTETDGSDKSKTVKFNEFKPSDIIVFGITGRKRSGKDTLGERLVCEHGFIRIAFADALKEACIDIFGFTREQVYGDDLKEVIDDYWGYSPREVFQKVGTELFRESISSTHVLPKIGKNIWVRTVERKIMNLASQGHRRFVITDVRFPNELAFLTESQFNSHSIKVVRQAVMHETDISKLHASESAIDGFNCDFEIKNDSMIEDLYTEIDKIIDILDN